MRIAGIIAEYNPFHRGHGWHVAETRARSGCDYVVACMAGHFTQRGEAAPFSKWARAQMALACGVDAVVELPTLFALRPADGFAAGGVGVLGGLGVDVLSFGCEDDDLGLLRRAAGLRREEPAALSRAVRRGLDAGLSHARARGEALADYLNLPPERLSAPNFTLAVEYLCAMEARFPGMEPLPIRRRGDYHDRTLNAWASATAIRAAMAEGRVEAALEALPEAARPFASPDEMHPMDDLLMHQLRGMPLEALAALPEVGEGLEHRLFRLCRETGGREALLSSLKCKRYTRARLSRTLTHALLGMTKDTLLETPAPPYARLLGARKGAEPLIRELHRRGEIMLAPSPKALRDDACFQLECRATDVWALLHDAPELRLPGREFREKFLWV